MPPRKRHRAARHRAATTRYLPVEAFMRRYRAITREVAPHQYWSFADGSEVATLLPKDVTTALVESIEVLTERSRGAGSSVLATLTDLADRYGVTLTLKVNPYSRSLLSERDTIEWYGRHGFEVTPSADTLTKMTRMTRTPKR